MNRNIREGLRWLDQVKMDLKTARDCVRDKNFYASAFFAQQSAEKALKGFFIQRDSEWTLIEEALKSEKNFGKFIDFGRELDRHYIGSRYLNFYPSGAPYKTTQRRWLRNA